MTNDNSDALALIIEKQGVQIQRWCVRGSFITTPQPGVYISQYKKIKNEGWCGEVRSEDNVSTPPEGLGQMLREQEKDSHEKIVCKWKVKAVAGCQEQCCPTRDRLRSPTSPT